jgi:DNA-binding transcriptional ArsR family regulator
VTGAHPSGFPQYRGIVEVWTEGPTGRTQSTGAPPLRERPLISSDDAARLEGVFKMLANDTRLRLLHALVKADELTVTQMAEAVGLRPQAVSNQLQRLADRRIVTTRRDGNRIWYHVCDPCVVELLDLAWCMSGDAR